MKKLDNTVVPPNPFSCKVRIIGGKFRGQNINFSNSEDLRPTGNRIKETLFNWLAVPIIDSNCLDLFAGSGSLSIESVSRGAFSATMIEKNNSAFLALKRNCSHLGIENVTIIKADAKKWLAEHKNLKPFDLIFLDPPFSSNLLTSCCSLLEKNGLLAENAHIYVETDRSYSAFIIPSNWQLLKEKTSGQVSYRLYKRI